MRHFSGINPNASTLINIVNMNSRSAADPEFMTSAEAAASLGVTQATLYAYVSRGKLAAQPHASRRANVYRRSEIERLVAQRRSGRRPREVARTALDWGLPVLESQLTLIDHERLYYRGQPALALAQTASAEEVACLLWSCSPGDAFGGGAPVLPAGWRRSIAAFGNLPPPDRLLAAFTVLQAHRVEAGGQADAKVLARHGGELLRLACAAALGSAPSPSSLHTQFGRAWKLNARGVDAVRAALVLCADHELNASGFTARCVASTGAQLGKAVVGGLAALSGGLHGGMTARVEALWDEVSRAASLSAGVRRCLARGDRLAGFGHPLYPNGDPRAAEILTRLPSGAIKRTALRLAQHVDELTGVRPTLDFALVALRRAIGAPEGGAYAVFAVGRTTGWIAHALEQRESGTLIRPRAAYVGVRPSSASPEPPPLPPRPASVFSN
jgi:citrate synthase